MRQVAIVHFNTPEITRACILSLKKHTDCEVCVFDNSDRRPFGEMEGVRVIDNTKGQIINFDEFLSRFPNKLPTANNWGSAKHCYSVQKLWEYFPNGFVLADSDVLFKKDISPFFDETVAYAGTIYVNENRINKKVPRLYPFLCWINVKLCKEKGVNYFDPVRNWKLISSPNPYDWYDTGASFLEDCRKKDLPGKEININEYIVHLGSASHAIKQSWQRWLEKYKYLYSMEEKKGPKYLVVIPFFKGGAQGKELDYAIAGWRRHFKENYQIVVVGDYSPVVDSGKDIMFIECERVPEQPEYNYRPHIDFVKKFKAVREKFPTSKGFIFVADDCYAVNDFDIHDVMLLKQNGDRLKVDPARADTPWEREKQKTIDLLKKEGYPTRNFTTHIPQWIEWDKLEALWERFDMEHNSYIFEDLYYNIYFPDRIPLQLNIDHDNMKCGVYRRNPRLSYIENAFKTKIWIQNSVEGWIHELDEMLSDYYGIK